MLEAKTIRHIVLALLLTTSLAAPAHAGGFHLLPEGQTPADAPSMAPAALAAPAAAPALMPPVAAAPAPALLPTAPVPAAPVPAAMAPVATAVPAISLLPSAAPSALPSAMPSAPTAAMPASRLMPFEQAGSRLELTGEDDTSVLTFYASAEQAAAGGALQIAYQNAVSVLPDTGTVEVTLNGQPAGTFSIRAPNGVKLETLPVAAGALKVGRNLVTLRARQRHRVDCSMDATYELWTRLDPDRSGFLAAAPIRFSALEELMGVARSAGGGTDIRLVVRKGAGANVLGESASIIQALGLFLNRDDITVSVGEAGGRGPGIDLYVGAPADRSQTEEGQRLLSAAPAGLSLRAGSVPGRAVVLLQGAGPTERNAYLLAALRAPMRLGLESGVMAARWGEIAGDAGKSFTLREAGYATAPFTGRLARTDFDLKMPADFYPADYDTIDFYLHAATAPGLARGAKMLLRVNGEVVSSLALRDARGEQFDRKRIKLPLRAFRPGVNRVELVAELPVAADLSCAPQMAAQEKPRLLLLDDSAFQIPALARLGRLPDLGALSGSAYPFSDGKPFDVFLDSQEPDALAGALTALVHLSLAARKPLDAAIRFGAPVEEEGRNALVVSTRATPVPPSAPAAPDAAGTDPFAGFKTEAPAGKDAMTTSALTDAPALPAASTRSLLEAFQESTAADAPQATWAGRTQAQAVSLLSRFRRWLNYENAGTAGGDAESGALLTVSQSQSPAGSATWTTLRAASASELQQGVAMLARPGVWTAMQGGRAVIQGSDGTLVSRPADQRVITGITDPSFGNLRRLAAAWFSDNFQVYVVLVLLLMGSFGAWLGFAVPKKGVRTDE